MLTYEADGRLTEVCVVPEVVHSTFPDWDGGAE